MSHGESAFLVQWAELPPITPPPPAVVVGCVLLLVALVAVLWVADARAAAAPLADGDLGRSVPAARASEEGSDSADEAEAARLRLGDLGAGALRSLAAARLRRFVEVTADPALDGDAARRCLARWAVFSAYRDCLALGLDEEARAVLRTPPAQPAAAPPSVATSARAATDR
jgi:hypothetical protein